MNPMLLRRFLPKLSPFAGRWAGAGLALGLGWAAPPVNAAPADAVGAWGGNDFGQTKVPVAAQSGVTAIAAGGSHTVALKSDGTVMAWGWNRDGQTNVPAGLSGVTAIAAGELHTVALKSDGTVVAWGGNSYGQTSVPAGLTGVTAIAAGGTHTVALKSDGTVVAWGENSYHQTNVPAGLSGVTAISAGKFHTVALKNDGKVVAWGSGPTTVPAGLSGVIAIAAGYLHTVALKSDGTVVTWGYNGDGQTTVPAGLSGVTAIAAGGFHTVALKSDGTVVAWGGITWGPTTVPAGLSGVTAIAAGGDHTVVLVTPLAPAITTPPASWTVHLGQRMSLTVSATGYPLNYQWRHDGVDLTDATEAFYYLPFVQSKDAGRYTVVVSNPAGSVTSAPPALLVVKPVFPDVVAAWGANVQGQVSGTPTLDLASAIPVALAGEVLSGASAIAAGGAHTVALKSDGTVVAWGDNHYGQVSGTPNPRSPYSAIASPIALGGQVLNGVTAVAAGGSHTVALKSDGTVMAWGWNLEGQTNVPAGLSGVTAVAAGKYHTVALKSDGTVIAWGWNLEGQTSVPAGLSGVTAIAAGEGHTVALKGDGTMVAWGRNFEGQTSVPAGLSGVTAIAAGEFHTVALKNDGTVVAWGLNNNDQTNVPVSAQSDVAAIAAGSGYTVALKTDGTVISWGRISLGRIFSGQLALPAGSGVTAIAGGDNHIAMLMAPRAPTITSPPVNQTVNVGQSASFTVEATGYLLSYQWRFNGVGLPGAIGATLYLPYARTNQVGGYTVVVSGLFGSVTSAPPALLTVTEFPPTITSPPVSQTVNVGQSVSFTVEATGYPLSYQWRFNGVDLPNATEPTLYLPYARTNQAGDYTVVVSNPARSVTSAPPALLTVTEFPPTITSPPVSQTLNAWQSASFTVEATGYPLAYQWRFNGVDLPDATEPTLNLGYAQTNHAGEYTVVVSNPVGSVTNEPPAVLRVDPDAIGTVVDLRGAVPAAAQSGVIEISAGWSVNWVCRGHSLALKNDGSVVEWPDSSPDQTGVPVAAQSGVTAVAAGPFHSVALKNDGSVVAWGNNTSGQVTGTYPGDNGDPGYALASPVTLGDEVVRGVTAIAAGQNHTVALKSDGTVVAWGDNGLGQVTGVFLGDTYVVANPVTLGSEVLREVRAVAAGYGYTLALKQDGTVVAWGNNDNGQTDIPEDLRGVTAIAAGPNRAVALKSDGTVVAWGNNDNGQTDIPEDLRGV
ncbi:MAG TPA: immunoglobulin domain-containing protein, partial [Verrucomicrobiota bacterium]|nr:immunoglobulin domain-containing protein [Verrucomicrobiota bacterium]